RGGFPRRPPAPDVLVPQFGLGPVDGRDPGGDVGRLRHGLHVVARADWVGLGPLVAHLGLLLGVLGVLGGLLLGPVPSGVLGLGFGLLADTAVGVAVL